MKQLIAFFFLFTSLQIHAQGYVDQKAMYPLSASQQGDVCNVANIKWTVYDYDGKWNRLMYYIDSLPGELKENRRLVIELANRITGDNMKATQQLFVPDSFPADYRAYTPYPFLYNTAVNLPKLFVIDKYTQTFGAYEYGKLVHWGLVSTGRKNNLTPQGRYNFNWKDEYRKSSAAPPGEVWEMYWLFNFHSKFGIHVHQYALPIGAAVSHGCVRTSESDAIWNYNWANGWVHDKKGKLIRNGTPVMVINNNPPKRPAHWKLDSGTVVSQVVLPQSLDEVRYGTQEQHITPWESGW